MRTLEKNKMFHENKEGELIEEDQYKKRIIEDLNKKIMDMDISLDKKRRDLKDPTKVKKLIDENVLLIVNLIINSPINLYSAKTRNS